MKKPEIILSLESDGSFYSELIFAPLKELYDFWKTKKVIKVWEKSFVNEGVVKPKELLLKSAQEFYIYLHSEKNDDWLMTIYYKIEQENELKLFTKNFLKQIKNATTDNTGAKTEN